MLKGLAKQKQVSFEKSGLVPHGQTSKGSVAWEGAAPAMFFRAAGSKRTTARGEETGGFSLTRATLTPKGLQSGPGRGQELKGHMRPAPSSLCPRLERELQPLPRPHSPVSQ